MVYFNLKRHNQRVAHCLKITQMSHFNFWILAFSTNCCPIKTDLFGNTVWPQASDFQKTRQNWPFLASLINFLSTQNVNLPRIAHNVEWDFFWNFQTPCLWRIASSQIKVEILRNRPKLSFLSLVNFWVYLHELECHFILHQIGNILSIYYICIPISKSHKIIKIH